MKDKKQAPQEPQLKKNDGPGTARADAPQKSTVLEWVRKDLQSAHYLLGVILHRHPEIVEEMAETVYETVMRKENGAAIDHEAAQTGLD